VQLLSLYGSYRIIEWTYSMYSVVKSSVEQRHARIPREKLANTVQGGYFVINNHFFLSKKYFPVYIF
jgi:hypothetical protein